MILRLELVAVLVAISHAATPAEAAELVLERNRLGRRLAHLVKDAWP